MQSNLPAVHSRKRMHKCFAFAIGFLLVLFSSFQASAHAVQVGYYVLPNGFIRVYIEHWHGDQTTSSLVNNGMSITTTYGSTTVTQNVNPTGAVNNTAWNALPFAGPNIHILSQGPSANRYNDWAYYDFAPAACNVPVQITLNGGLTVVLTEEASNIWPQTISGTFNDTSGPTITVQNNNTTVSCGSTGTNVNFTATAVDNCTQNPSVQFSVPSGSFFPVGTTNVTATSTDANGNTTNTVFQVKVDVVDNTLPVINCPASISVDNDPGQCSAVVNYSLPTYSDNCGVASITQIAGLPSGATFPKGTTVNTFRVTDGSNNSTTCSFSVTVADNEAPVAKCKNISVAIGSNLAASITAAAIDGGSYDNCGSVTLSTSGQTTYSCADIGRTIPVTLIVTDSKGLTSSCTAQVMVTDPNMYCNRPPVAICRNRTLSANNGCANTAATAASFNNGSFDPDGDTITLSIFPSAPYAVGTHTVTLTVTDAKGASSSCTATLTVVDNTRPVVTPPAAITVTAPAGQCNVSGVVLGNATATDNCGAIASLTNNAPAVYPVGATVVTWTAVDAAGNGNIATQIVNVVSNDPPLLAAVTNASATNDAGKCGAFVTINTPVATNACVGNSSECGTDDIDSYSAGAVSGQSAKWTPWDGGASGLVSSAQAFSGSNSVQLTNEQDQLFLLGDKTSGKWKISWKMYVPTGKTAYYNTQKFAQAPGAEFGHEVRFFNNGSGSARTPGAVTSFTYPQGQWFDVQQTVDLDADQTTLSINGVTIQTWQFSNKIGAVSGAGAKQMGSIDFYAARNVSGTDQTAIAEYYIDDVKFCGSNAPVVSGTRNDNQPLSAIYPVGTTNITWIATSGNGASSTTTQVVTVSDDEKPVVTCAPAVSVNNDKGQCGATITLTAPAASDNCGVASVVSDHAATFYPVGETTVTWTVTDVHGNKSSCSQQVTVTDNEAPSITCATIAQPICYSSIGTYTIDPLVPSDNCGIASTSYAVTGATTRNGNGNNASGSFNVGTSTIKWTVTDLHGNVSTCTTSVVINAPVTATIPNVYAVSPGGLPNTLYVGYGPSSVTLAANAAGGTAPYTYKWSNGATTSTIVVSTAGTYSVVVTDKYGCVAATASKTINSIDVRCGNKNDKVLVCQKTSSTTNPWVQICIAPSAVATHLANGSTLGQCAMNTVTLREGASKAPVVTEAAVIAYPNPTRGVVNLRLSNYAAGKVTIQLLDGTGKVVLTEQTAISYKTEDVSLGLGCLAAGVYNVRISSEKGTQSTKVVVVR